VFPGPSIKLTPVETLSLGCKLRVARVHAEFAVTADNGYKPLRHLGDANERERDFVAVAERFVGTPYLWGGKSSLGLDCSALVQLALTAAGVACLRDSDMQGQTLGAPIDIAGDLSKLRRGDLLFWKGHVAIVRDNATLIHANAYHMAVAIEPTAEAVARIRAAGSDVTSVRRLAMTA
jgi:cell wall-associated NlpC family hydrolase